MGGRSGGRKPGAWQNEARSLRGFAPVSDVAKMFGVNPTTVRRLFAREAGRPKEYRGYMSPESEFTQTHVYRQPKQIDMGPIVRAALAAVEARRQS